ncbi:hypothetical protein H8356DRAFT_1669670 [Neocallimastix lanati (nom. inval.)]|jgi:hypothetical protein|uniref:Uncharacterized protein n=1 Tax=Neocallimastix californiae TaxID=1754190 RepID=A0A1Y2EYI9_9FUNG|nr:hypothetical protein H8356DRAFT_1669670 [Neocallimastix sp. JGI-2020a]ORY75845.1 hypothetical protein LY90DRAFT_665718 [Neocallimastix californiae]|eukprot:ORY75845.1 hypothetical protein LY90DRAFT_665718 [Neocallimastix californiae]
MDSKGKWGFNKENFLFFIPPRIGMYVISALTILTIKIPSTFNLTGLILTIFDLSIIVISALGIYSTKKDKVDLLRYFNVSRWTVVAILASYYCYLVLFYFFFLDDLVEKCEDIYVSLLERNTFCNRSNIKHSIILELVGMILEVLFQTYLSYQSHKYVTEMQTFDVEYENLESQRYKNKHRIIPVETNEIY